MKLKALFVALAVAAILPVAALADEASPADKANGARACYALQAATGLGEATFKATYGTNADKSNAFGKCVSKWTQLEHQNRVAAETACKAEQADAGFAAAHEGKTFAQFYGNGKQGTNALNRCVQSSILPLWRPTSRLSRAPPGSARRSGRASALPPSRPSTRPPIRRTRTASASPSSPRRSSRA